MDIATFNQLEAGLWFCLSLVLVVNNRQAQADLRTTLWTAAGALLIFAISDVIEARTGAWWRPLWLLLLKAMCVTILLGCYLRYRHLKKP